MTDPLSSPGAPPPQPAPVVLDFGARPVVRPALPRGPDADGALPHCHAIAFGGSGSEYFRIWIVNLLLTLLTLSLYYPWAKVRKLRYFHANTRVAGHALDFHGQPRQMLRGYALVLVLAGAYSLAQRQSQIGESLALLLLALLWPALWRASMQFRLANTSWRGLRLRFTGSLGGAYAALALPWLAFLGFAAIGGFAMGFAAGRGWLVLLPIALMLLVYALLPYFWLRVKRYQHRHYAYAQLEASLDTSVGAVYAAFVRTAGLALLTSVGFFALLAIGFFALDGAGAGWRQAGGVLVAFAPLVALLFLFAQVLPRAYATARLQNLLWSGTGGPGLRFESTLGFGPLARLLLKNWLLVILTLGLYWPWAAIALARMRLEAVSLRTRAPLDELSGSGRMLRPDAAGDAAGDVFGIDLGL